MEEIILRIVLRKAAYAKIKLLLRARKITFIQKLIKCFVWSVVFGNMEEQRQYAWDALIWP